MRKSRFTEHQIVKILKEVEAGRPVREIMQRWLTEYNEERPHYSLGHLTQEEYLAMNTPETSTNGWR